MVFHQRDIVDVNFKLPRGKFEPHPVLVLSNDDINTYEGFFIGVMISGVLEHDNFSFPLTPEMLTKPMKKSCQVRCHLISLFVIEDIIEGKKNEMRAAPFKELLNKINAAVF